MSKKVINQNAKYDLELINSIESNFIYSDKPINRLGNKPITTSSEIFDKKHKISELFKKINSIEDCKLKNNSQNLLLGDGNINSPIMLIGEAPGVAEDQSGKTFQSSAGVLLEKMLSAINIKIENIYKCYAINFRPPDDRKPTSSEIKRYAFFLQEHISIIEPKIIILMGSTAMESLTGLNSKISIERGKWKEVIVKNTSYKVIITFNPSYLLRTPENKKYSWEDLKKIKQKIKNLEISI